MTAKTLLIVAALTTFSLYTFYKSTHRLGAKPENIKDCEAGNNYAWQRESFTTDRDIKPKELVTLMAKFMPQYTGKMTEFDIQVYFHKVKLWSQTNKLEKDYEQGKEVEVDYQLRLPGVIPSISV